MNRTLHKAKARQPGSREPWCTPHGANVGTWETQQSPCVLLRGCGMPSPGAFLQNQGPPQILALLKKLHAEAGGQGMTKRYKGHENIPVRRCLKTQHVLSRQNSPQEVAPPFSWPTEHRWVLRGTSWPQAEPSRAAAQCTTLPMWSDAGWRPVWKLQWRGLK